MAVGGGRVGGGQSTNEPMRFLPGLLSLSLGSLQMFSSLSSFFVSLLPTAQSTAGRAIGQCRMQ